MKSILLNEATSKLSGDCFGNLFIAMTEALESVNLTILLRQVADVRFGRDLGPGDILDEHLWIVLVTMLVNIRAEPAQQFTEITLADLFVKIPDFPVDPLP